MVPGRLGRSAPMPSQLCTISDELKAKASLSAEATFTPSTGSLTLASPAAFQHGGPLGT